MPPAKKNDVNNKSIKDFFKPFTIPKSRIPANDIIEDEIIVTQPKSSQNSHLRTRGSSQSPSRRENGFKSPQSSQASSTVLSIRSSPTERSTPDTLTHVSQAGSQRRVMTAVEIPSPNPPAVKVEEPTSAPLNTSFSTISTLSSVPMSTASSSRRITTKSGIQGITNSDSGSAESSSEDELADLSTFIPRKRVKLTPPEGDEQTNDVPSTAKPANKRAVRSSRNTEKLRGADAAGRASTSSTTQSYKYSLAALVRQQQKDEDVAKRMKDMEHESAAKESQRHAERQADRLAVSGLKAAAADDSDEGERVMLAMQRTGALDGEEKFYYFGGLNDSVINEAFPSATEDEPQWIEKLRNQRWRVQACLSGYAAELASKNGLPESIQVWMARQLLHEKRDDLCEAYIGILESCPLALNEEPQFIHPLSRFNEESQLINSLSKFYKVRYTSHNEQVPQRPHRIEYALRIAQHFKPREAAGNDETLVHLIFGMIDANVQQNASLCGAFEDCIENILAQTEGHDMQEFYHGVDTSFIRTDVPTRIKCRAIAAIPAFSERSHTIRRRLALATLLGDQFKSPNSEHCREHLDDYYNASRILGHLKSAPDFAISEKTNYSILNPLIQVLDIAIGNGFDNFHEQSSSKDATKRFNAQIDDFIDQLSIMASRIRDAGTTHLGRTQAKSAIERLVKRLEYSVRTKPRLRKGVFSGRLTVDERQRDILESFLKATDAKAGTPKGLEQDDVALGAIVES